MKDEKYLKTIEEIRAFSDPYRMNILRTYFYFERPATVKQVADEMNEVPAKVHYHVKKLLKAGILELHHTKEINGIVAKYYQPTAKSFHIKKQDELSDEIFLNETAVACSKILDNNKKIFIEAMKKKNKGSLSANYVYLTKEELKDVQETLVEIFNKYTPKKDKAPNANSDKYYLFTGIISSQE